MTVITYFIMIEALILYLFININNFDIGSPGLIILFLSIMLGFLLIFIQIILKNRIFIKKSFFVLLVFFAYLVFKIILDLNAGSELKSYMVGTDGGMILFYFLGLLVSINFQFIHDRIILSKNKIKIFNIIFMIFSINYLYRILDLTIEFSSNLREDILLLSNIDGLYQRPAGFLIIASIIYSFLFIHQLIINKSRSKRKLYILFLSGFYMASMICSIYFSQMLGSNNAFVSITGVFFVSIVLLLFSEKIFNVLKNNKFKFKSILIGKVAVKISISIFKSLLVFVFFMLAVIYISDFNIYSLRIFGFGSGEISSVTSRINLWANFITHFSYNPIFGNLQVDRITTGEGTYVHSFVASLLTHLGIVGFFIFFIYLFKSILERSKVKTVKGKMFFIYSLLVFSGMFLIASVGVFITWSPIWFLLGLYFPPILFENEELLQK